MKKLFLLLTLLLSISSYGLEDKPTVDIDITHIRSDGQWESTDYTGYFRFITRCNGTEHPWCTLNIQWITYAEDGVKSSQLLASRVIHELSDNEYYSFSEPECMNNMCSTLELKSSNSFTFDDTLHMIKLTDIGQYKVTVQKQ